MNYQLFSTLVCILIFSNYKVQCNICEALSKLPNPWNIFNSKVTFHLYNNEYKKPIQLYITWSSKSIKFDPSKRTTVIVHGYGSSSHVTWVNDMVKKLLEWQDMNIITVDWSRMQSTNYLEAASGVVYVGQQIQKLLIKLAKEHKKALQDWHYIHFIGHSLGAHLVGQAANFLMDEVYVHRITGLDPAGPFFHGISGKKLRLNKKYARFVDVIHTSSHPVEETLGLYDPMGHIDFYPNGGDRQPVCNSNVEDRSSIGAVLTSCTSSIILGFDGTSLLKNYIKRKMAGEDIGCDHGQASQYFIQSINSYNQENFVAFRVDFESLANISRCTKTNCLENTCVEIGINAEKYNSSQYYGTYYIDIPNC